MRASESSVLDGVAISRSNSGRGFNLERFFQRWFLSCESPNGIGVCITDERNGETRDVDDERDDAGTFYVVCK